MVITHHKIRDLSCKYLREALSDLRAKVISSKTTGLMKEETLQIANQYME